MWVSVVCLFPSPGRKLGRESGCGVHIEEGVQASDTLQLPSHCFIQMVGSKRPHQAKKRGHRKGTHSVMLVELGERMHEAVLTICLTWYGFEPWLSFLVLARLSFQFFSLAWLSICSHSGKRGGNKERILKHLRAAPSPVLRHVCVCSHCILIATLQLWNLFPVFCEDPGTGNISIINSSGRAIFKLWSDFQVQDSFMWRDWDRNPQVSTRYKWFTFPKHRAGDSHLLVSLERWFWNHHW